VSEFEVPAQSVDATQALNLSAGVSEKTRKEVTPILDSRERKLTSVNASSLHKLVLPHNHNDSDVRERIGFAQD
jgi:hypothetical protein